MIYLDYAATSPTLKTALFAFQRTSRFFWGNPNSSHSFGQSAEKMLFSQREIVADCLHCEPEQVIFTTSATESINLTMHEAIHDGYIHISDVEHQSVVTVYQDVGAYGFPFSESKFCCHIHTNNETGRVYNLKQALSCADRSFSDCTAAMGKSELNFKKSGLDYICGGGHKFGAPVGVGVLIAKEPSRITSSYHFATPSVPLAAAFAQALHFRTQHLREFSELAEDLHDRLITGILNELPDAQLNGKLSRGSNGTQSPYIANLSFPGVENHALVLRLAADGVMVSSGAACSSGNPQPSRVLINSGYSADRAASAIRFSFDFTLSEPNETSPAYGRSEASDRAKIDEAVKLVAKNVKELRNQ
jgi:cysteine desulfurase